MLSLECHDHATSRRLAAWLLVTTLVPAAALAGVGWAVVRADRVRDADRRREIREHAVTIAATALQRTVSDFEEQLSSLSVDSTARGRRHDGAAFVSVTRGDVTQRAGWPLPFYPMRPVFSAPVAAGLDRAEALEFRERDESGAVDQLRPLLLSADPATRGEALLRLARLERKRGHIVAALDAFERLSVLDDVLVTGEPAGLVGAQGRALTLKSEGRHDELARIATALLRDLDSGRWRLSRAEYVFAREQATRWLGLGAAPAAATSTVDEDTLAIAEALEAICLAWQQGDPALSTPRGRLTRWANGGSVLALTRHANDRLNVLLVGPRELGRRWLSALPTKEVPGIDLALTDADGRPVIGDSRAAFDRQAVRTASATNLPWTVHAIERGTAPGAALSRQAWLMLAALGVMTFAVAGGGYLTTRSIAREIRVSRQQSEFVSAVSHEFRTPLTAVRHLSQLLARGRVSSDRRRTEFYDLLVRESDRLHRLVEGLLNFARLEAGDLDYHFEFVDVGPYLRGLVQDFRQDVATRQARIDLSGDEERLPAIRADREVLGRVFWNLLDNAVKYSPGTPLLHVQVAADGEHLCVRVTDKGMGIPVAEQPHVFQKFVRGAAARAGSIKGTGIGLAMAREIVRAHGGDITLVSEAGAGSTFTVHLPVALEEKAHP